ncbi:uncharacterized protein LDX57_006696 [Aspergillus melleus]|uniref:uncharacterized protein n=1 Tax=Aspergillus melleus TaxID=138277 RepID=UPI001E8E869D|nr:uncharacterized protein LDX57_006696 [Aspergillus melleus]KAH8429025.1 hypothetical protein LDX57_006696 [Aspergillus melleus]
MTSRAPTDSKQHKRFAAFRFSKIAFVSTVGAVGGAYLTFRALQWAKGKPFVSAEDEESALGEVKYGRQSVVSNGDIECMKGGEPGEKHPARAPHNALTSPWPSNS